MNKRREKSFNGKKLLTIKEFSELSGIEQSTLRYWDEIDLFSPIARNHETNYRYYAPEQMMVVNFISVLSRLDVPLRVISELSKNRTPQSIIELIEQQEIKLDEKLAQLRESYSVIHTLRGQIQNGLRINERDLTVQTLESAAIVLGQRNEFGEEDLFYGAFQRFCKQAPRLHINLSYPIGGFFDSMDAFLQAPSQPLRFFSVTPLGQDERQAGRYLVGYQRGYYGEMGNLPQRMQDYAEAHGLALAGPVYVNYLHDEICMVEHKEYLAQVCAALGEE